MQATTSILTIMPLSAHAANLTDTKPTRSSQSQSKGSNMKATKSIGRNVPVITQTTVAALTSPFVDLAPWCPTVATGFKYGIVCDLKLLQSLDSAATQFCQSIKLIIEKICLDALSIFKDDGPVTLRRRSAEFVLPLPAIGEIIKKFKLSVNAYGVAVLTPA